MLKLVLIALEILKRIQQSRGTIKVSLTYQSQCSSITYQDALKTLHHYDHSDVKSLPTLFWSKTGSKTRYSCKNYAKIWVGDEEKLVWGEESNTVRFILTNFTTFVKILCNLSHFYNDLDRRCNNVHIWKNLQHSGSNRRPLDLEADALPLSYGALHSRIHETVKIIQLQAHTKFKIHNYIFSCMQSTVAQW